MSDSTVHRLLDEAFADVGTTPEALDLKEEIRANLMDRVSELTASGVAPGEAARRAMDELGDVHELLGADGAPDGGSAVTPGVPDYGTARRATVTEQVHRNRVTPSPRYVAGVVAASLVILVALAGAVALMAGMAGEVGEAGLSVLRGVPVLMALVGPAAGWIVASSLVRETTTSYALPLRRAVAYGIATTIAVIGLMLGVWVLVMTGRPAGGLVLGGGWVLVGLAFLVYLLTTQTNRKKPWVLQADATHQPGNRFEEDPAAAARFGIYTAVVWALTGVAALIVGATVGWTWVWIPGVLGWAVFMLMLATMLFGAKHQES